MWNFKATLWNSTQDILPIHCKMCVLFACENLRALRFKSSWAFLKRILIYATYYDKKICQCQVTTVDLSLNDQFNQRQHTWIIHVRFIYRMITKHRSSVSKHMRGTGRKDAINFHLPGFYLSNEDAFCTPEYCMRVPLVVMVTGNSTSADLLWQKWIFRDMV